ncbi:PRC-barrel domain containing protein [Haladaptatus halobius]|uniref:PRC-barrel domain containing protein n=1 Tax=Haladaptatus halobius TaxID=2884875 RepID=UPI001D0AE13E|nr:PRC-barrel domain containing protein [Haladaptatus halobius]
MRHTLTDDDEGKPVFNVDDQKIGIVARVTDGTAYIDPDPSLVNEYRVLLGWGDKSKDVHPLPPDAIDEITDKEIRLRTRDA